VLEIEFYQDEEGEWRWRAIDTNGKNVGSGGQGFTEEVGSAQRSFLQFAEHIKSGNYTMVVVK
jgi:hypothetical protein